MVNVVEPEPPVTVEGIALQVVSAGRPEQLKLPTVPVNPFRAPTLIVTGCDCPCVIVTCCEFGLSEKSDITMPALTVEAG
jgi:hypothetical protein